ncbi:glycosyltransferase family 2 protein [Paenibacillus sp. FSL P2-0089]|uniref:glycosyltransferase family 2 protein n=1 Tax=Paenibacillus sp. FSL P2-0089 TaxID=2954526 RepID=UPI00315A6166
MKHLNSRVSVVIPTFKRETNYLARAIESIKNQSYKNIEVVIVDDNPPDSLFRTQVKDFMQRYINDLDVIYLMNKKNIGGSLARNNGINVATGDYITFLDDDDEYLPEKIKRQLEFMLNTGADMSFTDLKLVNEKKEIVDYREYRDLKGFEKRDLLKYHIMRHLTGTPTFMYKSERLRAIGGFEDAKMGQEFYLMLKSIENELKIRYLPECDVIAYRHNDGGISQGENKITGELALYSFKKKYFYIFTLREKMFIVFRHYAVMVVAYKRNRKYFRLILSGLMMIICSPLDLFNETKRYLINRVKYRKNEELNP